MQAEIALSPIIGGTLTTRKALENAVSSLEKTQPAQDTPGFLNIGTCVEQFAFDYTPSIVEGEVVTELTTRDDDSQLIHFCVRLFRQLQAVGAVQAVDMTKYEERV